MVRSRSGCETNGCLLLRLAASTPSVSLSIAKKMLPHRRLG